MKITVEFESLEEFDAWRNGCPCKPSEQSCPEPQNGEQKAAADLDLVSYKKQVMQLLNTKPQAQVKAILEASGAKKWSEIPQEEWAATIEALKALDDA